MIKNVLLQKFNSGEIENLGFKRIFEVFSATSNFEKDVIRKAVTELIEEGHIVYDNGRFVTLKNSSFIKGVIKANERGFAFLITDSGDYFIPNRSMHGAFNGDTVLVKKAPYKRGESDEVEVVKILERGIKRLVGTFQGENGFGFVIPDDKSFFVDIYIPVKSTMGAKTGDKVLVLITGYPENRRNPEGKVLEILGRKYDLKAEELSIIKNAGLDLEFPKEVLKEVEKISSVVLDSELDGRKDFTNDLIITIDGEDSRDFDDAISIKENSNGTFTLGVHIADVSHYVKPNTALYNEALKRSTSVYFPERVIPMLPKKLSNGICSLNENEKRLTLSVIMDINESGDIVSFDIVKSVITSKKRMTYTAVQGIIDGNEQFLKEYESLVPFIKQCERLKDILVSKRLKNGTIEMDIKESHITVENGKINVEPRTSIDAYKVIEEFMIIANECVAEYVYYIGAPLCYRVHERPEGEKLDTFKAFLNALGIKVKWNAETCYPKNFSDLLESIKGEPIFGVVNKVMLRSLKKARYTTNNLGHFGLSSKCYCHFTSPIRRFPDLTVHAILKAIIEGKNVENISKEKVEEICQISSQNERKADEVERTMDDYYKCRYMRAHIGEEFSGIISGVTSFGVFVELENTVEGLVKVETLPRGNYKFDEKTFSLYSNSRYYALGEPVTVKILSAETSSRRIEMKITEDKYFTKQNKL